MPTNFQIVIPNKLYRSGRIAPSEISMLTGSIWKVRRIVSLDLTTANSIKPYIPSDIEHIIIPIELGGNPTSQARNLALAIKNGLLQINNGAVLVHCMAGRDRAGLAIALFRSMKQGWDCEAIFKEAEGKGYGSGLSPSTKRAFDLEICRHCHGDFCKKFTIQNDQIQTAIEDVQLSDDAVEEVRNQFSHQQGVPSSGSIPPAINPQQSFSAYLDPAGNQYLGNSVNIISASRNLRKSLLKLIIKLKKEQDSNDLNIPEVGKLDNYNGISDSQLNAPSGSPGAPNAAGPVDSGSLIQL